MGGEIIIATYSVLVMLIVLSSLKRLAHYSHNSPGTTSYFTDRETEAWRGWVICPE